MCVLVIVYVADLSEKAAVLFAGKNVDVCLCVFVCVCMCVCLCVCM